MGKYVLIKDGVVANIIVADESFIDIIKDDYDKILDYDEHPENFGRDAQVLEHEDGTLNFLPPVAPELPINNEIIDVEVVNKQIAIESPVTEEE